MCVARVSVRVIREHAARRQHRQGSVFSGGTNINDGHWRVVSACDRDIDRAGNNATLAVEHVKAERLNLGLAFGQVFHGRSRDAVVPCNNATRTVAAISRFVRHTGCQRAQSGSSGNNCRHSVCVRQINIAETDGASVGEVSDWRSQLSHRTQNIRSRYHWRVIDIDDAIGRTAGHMFCCRSKVSISCHNRHGMADISLCQRISRACFARNSHPVTLPLVRDRTIDAIQIGDGIADMEHIVLLCRKHATGNIGVIDDRHRASGGVVHAHWVDGGDGSYTRMTFHVGSVDRDHSLSLIRVIRRVGVFNGTQSQLEVSAIQTRHRSNRAIGANRIQPNREGMRVVAADRNSQRLQSQNLGS